MRRTAMALMTLLGAAAGAAAQGTLVLSELLFQPRSGEAEYVELYNRGDSPADLSDYHIVRWIGDSLGRHYPLPAHKVAPHDFAVLTKDAASVAANYNVKYASRLVECQLPTYPNAGGSVVLCTADSQLVERLDYTPSMHSRLLRDKAGVSLERRSYDRPASEASNWLSASSTSGYGTPGYRNSQSTEMLAEEADFSLSSEILSPDGDGYQDELEITYRLSAGTDLSARAEIYDPQGRIVRRLLNGDLLGSHGKIVWDGRDNSGNWLPAGQYVLLITLYDQKGTQQRIRRAIGYLPPAE